MMSFIGATWSKWLCGYKPYRIKKEHLIVNLFPSFHTYLSKPGAERNKKETLLVKRSHPSGEMFGIWA